MSFFPYDLSGFSELAAFVNRGEAGYWILCGARLLGLFLTVPLLASRLVPIRFRVALGAVLLFGWISAASAPALHEPTVPVGGAGALWLVTALLTELVVGMALGASGFLVLAAVRAAAALIGEQMGLSFGGLLDPSMDQGQPVLRGLYVGLTIFVLLATNGHHVFLRIVADSCVALPPGSVAEPGLIAGLQGVVAMVASLLFEATVVLILPVTAALLVASVAQGVLTRLFPELETIFFGFLLRSLTGLGVVTLSLPFIIETCQSLLRFAFQENAALVNQFSG